MKRATVQYHLITSTAFGLGFAGLLLWSVVHLVHGLTLRSRLVASNLAEGSDVVSMLAGLAALLLSIMALRQVEPETLTHRRATEGFVFGVIVLALTVGLHTVRLF
jgi:hypothetical protein